jgi:hypothetical protein
MIGRWGVFPATRLLLCQEIYVLDWFSILVKDGAGQNSIGQVKFFFVIFLD